MRLSNLLNTSMTQSHQLQGALKNSTEKISSGLKINGAADDAAGLAIFQKMRAQIRGLDMATKNSQDGIALLQVADGALAEDHAILHRLRELSIQAATDTLTNEDRQLLQEEVEHLLDEIEKIAVQTEFNTMKLLDGSTMTSKNPIMIQTGANTNQSLPIILGSDKGATLEGLGLAGSEEVVEHLKYKYKADFEMNIALGKEIKSLEDLNEVFTIQGNDVVFSYKLLNQSGEEMAKYDKMEFTLANQAENFKVIQQLFGKSPTTNQIQKEQVEKFNKAFTQAYQEAFNQLWGQAGQVSKTIFDSNQLDKLDLSIQFKQSIMLEPEEQNNVSGTTSGIFSPNFGYSGESVNLGGFTSINLGGLKIYTTKDNVTDANLDSAEDLLKNHIKTKGMPLILVPDNFKNVKYNERKESFFGQYFGETDTNGNFRAIIKNGSYGWDASVVDRTIKPIVTVVNKGVNVTTRELAERSIGNIDQASAIVSNLRSQIGAYHNRLEHTINNLAQSSENLTAAESRLADADIAKEMMAFTKAQLLQQASTAMQANANQQASNLLKLIA